MDPYVEIFEVHSYEVDAFGCLALAALAGYLQEAAWSHARQLDCAVEMLLPRGLTWVIGRQQFELIRAVARGERLEVSTWPSGLDRRTALRDFEVCDAAGELVARSVSHWFILDVETRKPVRPQIVLAPALLRDVEHVLVPPTEKLPEVVASTGEWRSRVRYQDIDINKHANNASYISWALEALPIDAWSTRRLAFCDVQYLSECRYGDAIVSRIEPAAKDEFHHSIVREHDGRELARLVTRWVRTM
ncbi:MAG: acyl-ACP thioesterase domain-containing protein [Polyangiaceae bacterium]|jgi:acyl-ACP thioesterase